MEGRLVLLSERTTEAGWAKQWWSGVEMAVELGSGTGNETPWDWGWGWKRAVK